MLRAIKCADPTAEGMVISNILSVKHFLNKVNCKPDLKNACLTMHFVPRYSFDNAPVYTGIGLYDVYVYYENLYYME